MNRAEIHRPGGYRDKTSNFIRIGKSTGEIRLEYRLRATMRDNDAGERRRAGRTDQVCDEGDDATRLRHIMHDRLPCACGLRERHRISVALGGAATMQHSENHLATWRWRIKSRVLADKRAGRSDAGQDVPAEW